MGDDYTREATGPLKGVKVIDLTINVLGPLATQILGDMGADVIKVEPPGGDPMRRLGPGHEMNMAAHFMAMNRNKRSIELDLKRPQALVSLKKLIKTADVLVLSMRASAVDRLGLSYESLAAENPRLIYASATGYARHGPDKDRPAYDDVIQGESGMAGMIASANGEARFTPMAIADKFCGTQLASAIGMALFAREKTGQGQEVHLPMLETMTAFNIADHFWEKALDRPGGKPGFPRMFTPHRRPYATTDGHICLLAVTNEQWARMLPALGLNEAAQDPRFKTLEGRTENINELLSLVAGQLATDTTKHWRAVLDSVDIPNGTMATLDGLFEDAYLNETGFFRRLEHPTAGPTLTSAPPIAFFKTPPNIHRPQPALGADGHNVLKEVGMSALEIDEALTSH
jgi:crotonobetainyl-CoA:carnitine CoA-transferase CaiB-like acyl-CoA transferase